MTIVERRRRRLAQLRQGQADLQETADVLLARHRRFSAVVRVVGGVAREQSAERVGLAASGAAFWLVITAVPTATAAMSLFGLVVGPQRVASVLGDFASAVPGSLGSLLTEQLRRIAAGSHTGLSFGLVVSLLVALWSASGGFYNLDRAVRSAYGLPTQKYLEARGRAVLGALAVVILLGGSAIAAPSLALLSTPVLSVAAIPVALAVIAAGVGALYRFSIGRPVPVRAVVPGAAASAVGVVLVGTGFGTYVATSTRYTAAYGALAGAVIGMLAIYLAVYVVLLGAVLNAQLTGATRPNGTR